MWPPTHRANMQSSARKSDITLQLGKYWQLAEFLGFTTFAYNASARRVRRHQNRTRFFEVTLLAAEVGCGFFFLLNFSVIACIWANVIKFDRHSWQEASPIVVQESLILGWYLVSDILFIGHLARHYLKSLHRIVPIVNEMLKIYAVLRKLTDSTLCVPRFLEVAVTARVTMLLYKFGFDFFSYFLLCLLLIGIVQIYGMLLTGTALMGHLYSQLVLIGFYSKMSGFVQAAGSGMSKEEFSENVQVLLTLSFRIHRVKGKLNAFFSPVFTSVFFELSFGFCLAYNMWKAIVFGNEVGHDWTMLFAGCFWLCCTFFVIIYDLYLICWLSDELVAMERRFMRDVLLLICGNMVSNDVQTSWEIQQIMAKGKLRKMKSVIFKLIDLDRPFVMDYLFNLVLQHLITCMQYYISGRYHNRQWKEVVIHGITGNVGHARAANGIE